MSAHVSPISLPAEEGMEELLARHRKQQKDLISQITALKKQASKKTRKAVNSRCAQMQTDLDAKQAREVAECRGDSVEAEVEISPEELLKRMNLDTSNAEPAEIASETPEITDPVVPRKRNRAKERIARRQAQFDQIQAEARAEAADSVDYRAIEAETMANLLRSMGYELHEIQPDGHCLFSSLEDQLRLRHGLEDLDVAQLRCQAASHMRAHPDAYIPYLFDQETMELRDINDYTTELENTAMWGSDMELAALAAVYGCPIKVLVAGSAPITFNPEGTQPTLVVAYYKHSYGLGEHYNSCR